MIVDVLKAYNACKTKIKLLEIEINDSISLGSKNIDDPLPGFSSVKSNTSVVERQADKICVYELELRDCRRFVNKVDEMLGSLTKEQETLIRALYVSEIPAADLAERYHVCLDTIYKRKKAILNRLEKFYSCFIIPRDIM